MGASRNELETLFEAATSASREHDAEGRIVPSPHWADLSPTQREELFARVLESRKLEAAADPGGLSTTARTVVTRISSLPQLD